MQTLNQKARAVHIDTYCFPYVTLYHEYDAHGCHRLVLFDRGIKYGGSRSESGWVQYDDICTLEWRCITYAARTEYRSDLPTVFRVEAAERLS